jgi:hypothetical protein
LPYWYGRLGLLKGVIADAASESAARLSLQTDISVLPHDVVTGARWLAFLRSGKTVVGAESGSSVIDPDGRVRRGVSALLAVEPELSYEEVTHRLADLADWDRHWCAVVSPRHLEAAFTRTVQVLVEGRYSGVLQAGKHYVPIRPDLSDLDDALLHALDPSVAAPMADEAFADIVESGRYNAERLTEALASAIPDSPVGAGTFDPMFAALRGAARLGDRAVAGRGRLAALRRRRAN